MPKPTMMLGALLVITGTMSLPCVAQADFAQGEVKAIAEEAFVYGFPMVMNYGTMYEYAIDTASSQYKAPFNRISNTARVFTPKDTAIVTPNSDTPYSFLWMDLRAEPVVLIVPKIDKGRYFSVQLVDLYTHNYGYLGTRTTGNGGGTYMVAGPSWNGRHAEGHRQGDPLRDRVLAGRLPHPTVRVGRPGQREEDPVRVQGADALVFPRERPLHPPPAAIDWPKIDKSLAATNPFAYLNVILQFCPTVGTAEVEKPLRQRFARIGIEPGNSFTTDHLTPDQKAELEAGMKSGLEKIKQRLAAFGKEVNGWRIGSAFGDRDFYKGDWTLRAAAAMGGIYGNNATEAIYPLLATDSQGNRPDCSKARYTLTFPKGQFPPANAFWSVTMYDAKSQLLIENPIHRYLINSTMLPEMNRNEDGSLPVYIQKDSPGKDKESNWLPAPDGPIFVVMRVYWPKEEALDGTWKPPAVVPVK